VHSIDLDDSRIDGRRCLERGRSRGLGGARALPALIWLLATLASQPGCGLGGDQQAVRTLAPNISRRANLILKNLLSDCALVDGRWQRDMGPGCTGVWASRFGYEAGRRRKRQDIWRIGEATASEAAAACARTIWQAVRNGLKPETPTFARLLPRIPALWISGTRGDQPAHLAVSYVLRPMIWKWARAGRRGVVHDTALALFFADCYRLDPTVNGGDIDRARFLAKRTDAPPQWARTLTAMAWAGVAKASGDPKDLERARAAASVGPRLIKQGGAIRFAGPYPDCLSLHLALIHAYADLAELEPAGLWRRRALALLEYVFSDAYFDGRFLVHDLAKGQSQLHCSGCNFHALYLADRVLGDALSLEPVPAPRVLRPDRPGTTSTRSVPAVPPPATRSAGR